MKEKDIVLFNGKEAEVRSILPNLVILFVKGEGVLGVSPDAVKPKPKATKKK